jgi:hypothetical protein
MAQVKTVKTDASVADFLASVENETRRKDSFVLLDIMKRGSGAAPAMWGPSIVGCGETHVAYASDREGDWPEIGFAPRKSNLAIYVLDPSENFSELRGKLGKHRVGKACLWINKLADVDLAVLEQIIQESVRLGRSQ